MKYSAWNVVKCRTNFVATSAFSLPLIPNLPGYPTTTTFVLAADKQTYFRVANPDKGWSSLILRKARRNDLLKGPVSLFGCIMVCS